MFPKVATPTNTPEPDEEEQEEELSDESSEDEVLEELSSAHDEAINAILTIRTNQEVRLLEKSSI